MALIITGAFDILTETGEVQSVPASSVPLVINMIDANLLKIVAPNNPSLEQWVDPIKKACIKFNIDTVREVACYLSQSGHESSGFTRLEESLNYSAQRLMQVWPKRFPNSSIAERYAHNPKALANNVYSNRLGNGDESSGDGYRFRGGGLFQLTGRENYTRFGKSVGMNAEKASDYVRTIEGAAISAGWYFEDRGLDKLAATPGVEDETKAINGGSIGLDERRRLFDLVVKEFLKRGA
jgi:putative chitinase